MSRLTLLIMLDATLMLAAMAFVGMVMRIAHKAAGHGEPQQIRTPAPVARSPRRAYVPATSQG